MMGKDHIMISLAWGFLLASPILIQYPVYFIAFIIGITLGSVYPDIDSSYNPYGDVSSDDLEEGRGALTALMRFVAYPAKHLTGFIVSKGNKDVKKEYLEHRNLMHSILGVVLSLAIILVPLNLIFYFIGYWNLAFFIGTLGVLVGAFMHLLEDSCTLSGIMYLYPYVKRKLKGNVNVECDSTKAGKKFTPIFVVPACVYLVCDLYLKNQPMLSQFNIIGSLPLWTKLVLMFVVGLLAWIVCFRLAQTNEWTKQKSNPQHK